MRNAGLDKAQGGMKIVRENINNLRYADDTMLMASGSITSWEIDGETVKTVADFIYWAPKSLQMVIAAMKLKDICFLEENLWPA